MGGVADINAGSMTGSFCMTIYYPTDSEFQPSFRPPDRCTQTLSILGCAVLDSPDFCGGREGGMEGTTGNTLVVMIMMMMMMMLIHTAYYCLLLPTTYYPGYLLHSRWSKAARPVIISDPADLYWHTTGPTRSLSPTQPRLNTISHSAVF